MADTLCSEEWTNITEADLPIPLDTPSGSTVTLRPILDNSSRFSLNRLKNFSRISVQRPKSFRLKVKARLRLPFIGNNDTCSLLDQFPAPPTSVLPTPITPTGYTWPSKPFVQEEQPVSAVEERGVGPLKSLSRALTRRIKSSKAKSVVVENTTVVLGAPRPNKPLPDPPVEQPKTYQLVDPVQLFPSPSPFLADLTVSARNSFIPPSPSWLSRNVHIDSSPETQAPTSPPPLPIPPRIMVSDCSDTDTPLLSPLEPTAGWLEYPRQSFISVSRKSSEEQFDPYKVSTGGHSMCVMAH